MYKLNMTSYSLNKDGTLYEWKTPKEMIFWGVTYNNRLYKSENLLVFKRIGTGTGIKGSWRSGGFVHMHYGTSSITGSSFDELDYEEKTFEFTNGTLLINGSNFGSYSINSNKLALSNGDDSQTVAYILTDKWLILDSDKYLTKD